VSGCHVSTAQEGLNPGGGMLKFTIGMGGDDTVSLVNLFMNGGG
jgi:hypothetical protein